MPNPDLEMGGGGGGGNPHPYIREGAWSPTKFFFPLWASVSSKNKEVGGGGAGKYHKSYFSTMQLNI